MIIQTMKEMMADTILKLRDKIYGPRCPCCKHRSKTVSRRRRNTRYLEDHLNFLTSCDRCFDEDAEYWAERWEDHRRSVL